MPEQASTKNRSQPLIFLYGCEASFRACASGSGKTDLEMFDGFGSEGAVAVEEGAAETPVVVLRDTASGQSVLVAGTIDLPEKAALGTFVPIKGFGGTYSAVPLY